MKISLPVCFILIIAISFYSCKKNFSEDLQAIEGNDPQLVIQNWQQYNNYRSETSLHNFEHNIVFEWNNKFLYDNTWFVPSALIIGDSFRLYRILQYPFNKMDKKSFSIKYMLVPIDHLTNDVAKIIEESVKGKGNIQNFISLVYPIINSSVEQNGSILAVRKSKKTTISSNAPIPEGCEITAIDWYWQTYENGVLVDEEYLFTTNEIVCEGSGGGGGGVGNIPTLNNPCDSVAKLDSNSEFKAKLDTLKNKTIGNKEYCFVYKNTTNSTFEETMDSGEENSLGTNYSLGQDEKIDGIMHNHFFVEGKSLSIFSDADILDLIKLYRDGNISAAYKFAFTLVSQNGRQYMLKINDLNKFMAFAENYKTKELMMSMMRLYNIKPDITGQDFNNSNEMQFLKFLEQTNSGLKFFKANPTSSGWNPIKISGNSIIADPCD